MTTIIGGHTLTRAERETLDEVLDYMRKNCGDTGWTATTSPKGDGRDVDVDEIFGAHNNQAIARRRTLRRLNELNILFACEIELKNGLLRTRPL